MSEMPSKRTNWLVPHFFLSLYLFISFLFQHLDINIFSILPNADTLFTVKWKNFKWKTPDNWPNCRAIKSQNKKEK